ncbi:MAG: sigma-70 family RNA polymerase sigma factor [Proteobacteria bacterium]|nr:sigma-70 family RNA polymerase sigma factor [Pseudomonadota bacterium]
MARTATPGAPVTDPVSHLAEVYRDFPGLRALILRRVRDPEIAADILQDAAVTTLQKLKSGDVARPEQVGGYLYRVALNHLRNYRRRDRVARAVADGAGEEPATADGAVESVDRHRWMQLAREVLADLPNRRDRELLVRFYLEDEDKQRLCAELGLTEEHFHRVIFRARNRFRELLAARGLGRADLLSVVVAALGLATAAGVPPDPPATGTPGAWPMRGAP